MWGLQEGGGGSLSVKDWTITLKYVFLVQWNMANSQTIKPLRSQERSTGAQAWLQATGKKAKLSNHQIHPQQQSGESTATVHRKGLLQIACVFKLNLFWQTRGESNEHFFNSSSKRKKKKEKRKELEKTTGEINGDAHEREKCFHKPWNYQSLLSCQFKMNSL